MIWVLAGILLVPAFFLNLGLMPYTSDEPTRAIVTLEMLHSGNFITPTLTGEFYYNKPPLYNWILAGFIQLNGGVSEGLIRLPTLLFLAAFALSIFLFTKRHFGTDHAILASMAFLTCGRILFWDSMLGLIDMLYSWLTFLSFTAIINNLLEKRFLRLFLVSYLMAALGFMLKGMPSLVFQGISLLTLFLLTHHFKKLFSASHFAGIGIFLLITGSYLLLYSRENSLQQYLHVLWDQSSQRTAASQGFSNTLKHLFLFHPSMLYHFLPWSIPVLLLLQKDARKTLFGSQAATAEHESEDLKTNNIQRVNRMLAWLFVANILVYWLSPATIPRYVLMLAPLTFIPLVMLLQSVQQGWLAKGISILLFYLIPAAILALFASLPWIPTMAGVAGLHAIAIAGAGCMAFIIWRMTRNQAHRLPMLVISLLLLRIAYNLTFLPVKTEQMAEQKQKMDALEMVQLTRGNNLQIVGKSWVDHATLIYLTSQRKETIRREYSHFRSGQYYLADEKRLKAITEPTNTPCTIHKTTLVRHEHGTVYLISFRQDFSL